MDPAPLSFAGPPAKALFVPRFRARPRRQIDHMPRAAATRICLWASLFFGSAWTLGAQTVESPLVPRGSLFFRMDPSATTVEGLYASTEDGQTPLGSSLSFPALGTGEVPALIPVAERLGSLAGLSTTPSLRIGGTVARLSGDERVVPLQLSYGLLDRLTLGVTVPFIRKRVETLLRLDPEGAEVGLNPIGTGAGSVPAFLGDAQAALITVQDAVDAFCLQRGEEDLECIAGRGLVGDTDSFLTQLDGAYQEEDVFPLEGSVLGDGVTSRWLDLVARFSDWGTTGPEGLPLASDPLNQSTFESLVVAPAWGTEGFPLETPDAVMGLGDVEVNVAIGLLEPAPPPPVPTTDPGTRVHAAAVASIRFGTGSPDSLRMVSPIDPPRGVSGFSVRGIADLIFGGRLGRVAILGTLEAGWNGSRDVTLLVPDPTAAFNPSLTRSEVSWSPGPHLRASVTPRFRFGPGLSVGAGWHLLRRDPDEFAPVSDSGGAPLPAIPAGIDGFTQQRIAFEIRYTTMHSPLREQAPFPFEILFRGSRSFAGTDGAVVESRAEAMVRFRLRD